MRLLWWGSVIRELASNFLKISWRASTGALLYPAFRKSFLYGSNFLSRRAVALDRDTAARFERGFSSGNRCCVLPFPTAVRAFSIFLNTALAHFRFAVSFSETRCRCKAEIAS